MLHPAEKLHACKPQRTGLEAVFSVCAVFSCLCYTPSCRCLQGRSEHRFPQTSKNGKSSEACCENKLEDAQTRGVLDS